MADIKEKKISLDNLKRYHEQKVAPTTGSDRVQWLVGLTDDQFAKLQALIVD